MLVSKIVGKDDNRENERDELADRQQQLEEMTEKYELLRTRLMKQVRLIDMFESKWTLFVNALDNPSEELQAHINNVSQALDRINTN